MAPHSATKYLREASLPKLKERQASKTVKEGARQSCNFRINGFTRDTQTLWICDDTKRLIEELGDMKW